ncbi:hypothetical protein [Paraburkholderia terricola]|uniref:hypothetical protein n=1 Tax=Paraburkholderia terricola TaxID=169427 RepID=UPI003ECE8A88
MDGAKEIVSAILSLKADLDQRHGENIMSQSVTDKKVVEIQRGVDELRRAFPDGDWDGHRRYHEAVIKRMEARAQFYRDLSGHLIKGGAWALIVFLAWASWQAIKAKVNS